MRLGTTANILLGVSSVLAGACTPNAAVPSRSPSSVTASSSADAHFVLDGRPFCFAGTNNYYLTYKSRRMVDDVFGRARAMGLKVVRFWGFIDRGALDGTVPSIDGDGTKDGVYFQYWDVASGRPAYHEGPDGLERLDYVLHRAKSFGLKLILVLTNNWREFGGMDQYLTWYGLSDHQAFYTDPRVKQAYQSWIAQLVLRRNRLNGIPYRDDPTIFAWELANEPRCRNVFWGLGRPDCDPQIITRWAGEMSAYIKSLDPKHLVAVGDEGFFSRPGQRHFSQDGRDGIDHEALLALPEVDFGTFHLYPDNWGTDTDFGAAWIEQHLAVARAAGKPTVLEEYGTRVGRNTHHQIRWGWPRRQNAYREWNELMLQGGGSASLFWMLAGVDDGGARYPDYDQYQIYYPGPTAQLLREYAQRFSTEARACQRGTNASSSPTAPGRGLPGFVQVQRPWHGADTVKAKLP